MTVIEIGGLLLLVFAGFASDAGIVTRMPEMVPTTASPIVLTGLISTTLLAVFAFIGFEGLAKIAEEVREPRRTLPRAIFLTLAISMVLYATVVWIALVTVGPSALAQSSAPLALVFERLTGAPPATMSLIAIVATLNGIIVQIIMSSRVLYGLSRQRGLPAVLGRVSARTRTPVIATALTTVAVLVLALALPLHHLADVTARLTLVVFTLVNLSLIRLKAREPATASRVFVAPRWMPWAGAAACIGLLALDLATMLAR
jgi:amino acid transporter